MDAETFVRNQIETVRKTSSCRLPTVSAMARESGLSPHHIRRAIARLRGPERLHVSRGSGIRLRSSPPLTQHIRPVRRSAGEEAAITLVRRMQQGAFVEDQALPSMKELSHAFGVHRATMRSALERLAREGWVRRDRGRWFVRVHGHKRAANHIVFLGRDLDQGIAQSVFPGAARMMAMLDQECARRAIKLQFVAFDQQLRFPEPGAEGAVRSALGAVIWPYSLPPGHTLAAFATQCRSLQERVVILDQTGRLPHPPHSAPGLRGIRCYSLSQSEFDGYDVAVHLLQRGHRRVAFLAYDDQASWSQRRRNGVLSAFASYGVDRGVRRIPPVRHPISFQSPEVATFIGALREFFSAHGLQVQGAASMATKPYQFMAEESAQEFLIRSAMAQQLRPSLERALDDRGTTAWICASDDIAFAARQFLVQRRVGVPDSVSLVGFDDSRLAMHYQFNSYNFNMHGLAAEIVNWILHGTPSREDCAVRRVAGFVNDRGTVANVGPRVAS
jgi:DNA-binding GntR family transcriptional regulator